MLKKLIFFLMAIFVAQCVINNPELDDQWNIYKTEHGKHYTNKTEEAKQKENFAETHSRIVKHSNKKTSNKYTLKHNAKSTLSKEEIKQHLLGAKISSNNIAHSPKTSYEQARNLKKTTPKPKTTTVRPKSTKKTPSLPAKVDWRSDKCMQPVKDQGKCSSCWAFSTVAAVEFGHCKATSNKVSLSEQQLVDCSTANKGCNEGVVPWAFQYIADAGGLNTQCFYPYIGKNSGVCKYNSSMVAATISSNPSSTKLLSVTSIQAVIASGGIPVATFAATYTFINYASGVYDGSDCSQQYAIAGYHAVAIVGYGTMNGVDYWVVRNSWGPSWGNNGYGLIQRGINACEFESYVFSVKTTS